MGRFVCECDEQQSDDDHLRAGSPEIYDYGEIPLLIRRDGAVTNRWADGIAGVPERLQERAELLHEVYCDECQTYASWKQTAS